MRLKRSVLRSAVRSHEQALRLLDPTVVCVAWVSSLALAQTSFTDYNDVQQVLAFLTDVLPADLKSSDLSVRRNAWPSWVVEHDRDIRGRLLRGDEDTLVNWLLFGTSFSQHAPP